MYLLCVKFLDNVYSYLLHLHCCVISRCMSSLFIVGKLNSSDRNSRDIAARFSLINHKCFCIAWKYFPPHTCIWEQHEFCWMLIVWYFQMKLTLLQIRSISLKGIRIRIIHPGIVYLHFYFCVSWDMLIPKKLQSHDIS